MLNDTLKNDIYQNDIWQNHIFPLLQYFKTILLNEFMFSGIMLNGNLEKIIRLNVVAPYILRIIPGFLMPLGANILVQSYSLDWLRIILALKRCCAVRQMQIFLIPLLVLRTTTFFLKFLNRNFRKLFFWFFPSSSQRPPSFCLLQSSPMRGSAQIRGQCYKIFYDRNLRIFVISWSVCPWQAFPA